MRLKQEAKLDDDGQQQQQQQQHDRAQLQLIDRQLELKLKTKLDRELHRELATTCVSCSVFLCSVLQFTEQGDS